MKNCGEWQNKKKEGRIQQTTHNDGPDPRDSIHLGIIKFTEQNQKQCAQCVDNCIVGRRLNGANVCKHNR